MVVARMFRPSLYMGVLHRNTLQDKRSEYISHIIVCQFRKKEKPNYGLISFSHSVSFLLNVCA